MTKSANTNFELMMKWANGPHVIIPSGAEYIMLEQHVIATESPVA